MNALDTKRINAIAKYGLSIYRLSGDGDWCVRGQGSQWFAPTIRRAIDKAIRHLKDAQGN